MKASKEGKHKFEEGSAQEQRGDRSRQKKREI